MKRKNVFILIFIIAILIFGLCFLYFTLNRGEVVKGIVVFKMDNSVIISEVEKPSSLYSLNLNKKINDKVNSGDIILVTHDGNILEIYPSQFSKIYKIKVVAPAEKDEYKTALTVYLGFLKGLESPNDDQTPKNIKEIEDELSSL